MTTETQAVEQVVSAEPTENNTAEPAETQEVAAPEGEHQEPAIDAAKALEATKRRIDRLTADKYRTKAENEQLKQEREHLRQQLSALQGGSTEQEQSRLTSEDVERHAREIVEMERFNAKCNDIAEQGKKAYKGDFDKALATLAQATGPLFTPKGKPEPLMAAILDAADKPHQIIHYLGTNPEVAEDLADLSPLKQAKRIAQIERDLSEKPKASNAPKPLQPVKAAATSAAPDPKKDPEAWIKWRNEQTR